uniref:tRNA N(3)-methylcytidine methyltransferase n=1 Tax=Rhizophora mucronata TaxID=61149 RepID=A0A2P2JT48_RHIMU
MSGEEEETKTDYHSRDFDWETLKQQIERNPSYQYHLLPFTSQQQQQQEEQKRENTQLEENEEERESEDSKAWKNFHLRHSSGKFFKERRYLLKEFPELVSCTKFSKVLEVGCGNGSSVIPILRGNKTIIVYACDCSEKTLERAKEIVDAANISRFEHQFQPFCCDFTFTGFLKWLLCDSCQTDCHQKQQQKYSDVKESGAADGEGLRSSKEGSCCIGRVDFVTLIFTLSAVPLKRMPKAIGECFSVLRPGGLLLFRDYGLYDMTMLRFESEQRVGFREYMRADGTRSYFFCLDTVRDLFVAAGFIELELAYCCINSTNRRKGKSMLRVWVHGKFQKPIPM